MLIGICGGIGSGKSVVSRALRLRGERVYDCDMEARRIMDTSREVLHALHSRYGAEVCPEGGPISRPALAERIFGCDDERLWLNSLVHGLVRCDVERWSRDAEACGYGRCFVESAILASSGLAAMCSEVWLVTAPEELRISRVAGRDGHVAAHIRSRIRSQSEEENLLRQACQKIREIDNSGLIPLLPQL